VRFDPAVLANDPPHRSLVLRVLDAALDAVDPVEATRSALGGVEVGARPPILLGLGKAARGMAAGAAAALGEIRGTLVTPDPGPAPAGIEVVAGEHPIPGPGSLAGGRRLLEVAASAANNDLVVALISGGGSACAEVPAAGLTTADLAATTDVLLRSGAPITEINAVRRHLSDLKGGRLAEAASPATVLTLIVSDVAGGDVSDVAGGPTVPDPTTPGAAIEILSAHGILGEIPPAVVDHLRSAAGRLSVGPWGPVHVVASGAHAAEGARRAAEAEGVAARILTTLLAGEAAEVGREMASLARHAGPSMLIAAGETTVRVSGSGVGGRNQELALAAGIALEGEEGRLVASLGTDGVDGPTNAAGGIGDGATVARGGRRGEDARIALADHDSNRYLAATGDLLHTGPTGTNVGDVVVVSVRPR
jgi:hydroxypyruvate reductase